ncbi:hypothetical protein [Psittacicella hinzii]|uniref:DUF1043 family protein n=1 Tax=Psittacicella hinzii TaxID=2028575 RepID=A0A3A1YQJ8_9GAMM|nr:hypothetical protein [Psittacicella hinzii]RIY40452.1 hypothetical protein CKF58_00530 [Psittacicella hinzii]
MSTTTTSILVVVLFVAGILLGYLLARGSGGNEKRIHELKSELTSVRKAHQESLEQVNAALDSVKNLAVNMAATYKSLEFTKASLEGRQAQAQDYLLQIKNGQLEQIAYQDHNEAQDSVAPEAEIVEATANQATDKAEK